MNVVVRNTDIMVPTDLKHESYSLVIRNGTRWELTADYYPGFLRGFETFSQLLQKGEERDWTITDIPIVIDDAP